jgi:nucleoside-diphosphate-sugar epimerase
MALLSYRTAELRKHRTIPTLFERDRYPITDSHLQGVAADDIREHACTFVEVNQRYDVGRLLAERLGWGAANYAEALDGAQSFAFYPFNVIGPAMRAQMPRHEVRFAALVAMTEHQAAVARCIPIRQRIGVGDRLR